MSKRLGDYVSAGEAVAYLESRDASTIAAERSTASAKLIAARTDYSREKGLFDARHIQSAASTAKVSIDGRYLAVTSLILGRITKVDTQLGPMSWPGPSYLGLSTRAAFRSTHRFCLPMPSAFRLATRQ